MKILLLGCQGQVGWELQRSLSVLGTLVALGSKAENNPQGLCGDLTDLPGLRATIRQLAPDVIVNAAAHTAVDKAQSEPERAHAINALAPAMLAQEAQALGAWLLHYSTDYVFDGSGSTPWDEDASPRPLNVYGHSKRAGEQAVAACPRHLILRTSWVYATRGANFAKTMLRLAAERDTLTVIDDQIGAPTSAELLADVSAQALQRLQTRPDLAGLYHCVAAGETSWNGYARFVLQTALEGGHPLKARPDTVMPIATRDYPTPAQRPLNSRLNTRKLQEAFGLHLPDWRLGVTRMLREISGK